MDKPCSGDEAAMKKLKILQKECYEIISKAIENEESKGPTTVSIDLYKDGIQKFKEGLSISIRGTSERANRSRALQAKMQGNLDLATERLRVLNAEYEAKMKPNPSGRASKPKVVAPPMPRRVPLADKGNLADRIKNVDRALATTILNEVLDNSPPVKFEDIVGNDAAKSTLREMVIYPSMRPDLFTGLRSPPRGLLLFGPPGNGKTLLAKAVAHESQCVFFNISAATLVSKWVGESEKLVRALFAMARELQPAIIFIDEVDSLLSARRSDDKESSRRLLTQFLQEFDGITGNPEERIIIISATNCPQDLDQGALRRLPKRLLIPMPNEQAREQLIRHLLKGMTHQLEDGDIRQIANLTENYSASDLKHLVKDAAMAPLREFSPENVLLVDKSTIRSVEFQDFRDSLQRIRPSLSPEGMQKYLDWAKQYGQTAVYS